MSAQSKSHSIEMCVPPDNRQQTKSIQQKQLNKFVDPLYIYIVFSCIFFSLSVFTLWLHCTPIKLTKQNGRSHGHAYKFHGVNVLFAVV